MSERGHTIREDISVCREIAIRANANLLYAARILPSRRQDFFFACYAAMRLIDDRVDDDFLCLPKAEREHGRQRVLSEIDEWLAQCLGRTEEGPLPPPVCRALNETALRSDLGDGPWLDLAGAMQSDASEEEMPDWADFLRYAEGATVAPATIFIYLLAAESTPDGFRYALPEAPKYYASDLGIFCYLVHILRDLSKDSGRSERLVTIPASVLRTVGLDRAELAHAIARRDAGIPQLAEILHGHAKVHLTEGRCALEEIAPHLGWREEKALRGLIAIYEKLFEKLSLDVFSAIDAAAALEQALRQQYLDPAEK